MAEVSTFRNVILFLEKIGVYDVVLPFLLVFTIVFAILEKTKVFGMDEVEGQKFTKKNIDSMAAFVISFLVIASSQLVEIITTVSSQVVILLMLSVFFLLLIGSFYKEGDGVFLEGGWKTTFMIIMFVGILAIFLQAIKTKSGEGWLTFILRYMANHWSSTAVASLVLVGIVVLFMYYVVRGGNAPKKEIKTEG